MTSADARRGQPRLAEPARDHGGRLAQLGGVGEPGVEARPASTWTARSPRPRRPGRRRSTYRQPDPCAAADVDDRSVVGIDAGQQVEQLQPEAVPHVGRQQVVELGRRLAVRIGPVDATGAAAASRRRRCRCRRLSITSASAGDSRCTQRASFCPGWRASRRTSGSPRSARAVEHTGDLVDRVEPVLTFGAALQLPDRLRAAQHQHRQHRRLGGIEHQHVRHHVAVLDRPVRRAVHGARQPAAAQRGRAPARSPARCS